MKKLLVLALAVVLCFTFAACGGSNEAVQKYVDENGSTLLSSFESSFATSSGMTCESDIEVEGDGFIINVRIDQLDNLTDSQKETLQATYDALSGTFDGMLADLQKECPELQYFTINVCEKDGDVAAEITAGK